MPFPPNQRRNSASVMTRPSGQGEGVLQTGIVLVGDRGANKLDGATFSLNGVEVPYAPGAAQWLPTTPANTEIFIPANVGSHNVKVALQNRVVKEKTGVQVYYTPTASGNRTRVSLDQDMRVLRADQEPAVLSLFNEHRSVTIDGVEQVKPEKTGSPRSFKYTMPDTMPVHNIIVDVDDTNRYSFPSYFIQPGTLKVLPLVPRAFGTPVQSFTDVNDSLNLGGTPGPGDVFSITGVPASVTDLQVKENERRLMGSLASGTWTASNFDVSNAAILTVTPIGAVGEGLFTSGPLGRPLTTTVAIPVTGLTVAYSSLTPVARPSYTGTPPAMTGIVLVGDINSIGGATFSLDGVAVAYAPGAAQWLPTTPAYTKLFIPAAAGAHVVQLIKGGQTLRASVTVAANMVSDVPVTGMVVETTQRVTDTAPPAMTGIVLVGDINSIGGATFSLDGVAVPYAPGAAQWLPTTPAYTKLFIPAPAGAHVVRLIKGGRTLMASATVAANLVTDVPVSNMTVETQGTTQQLTDTPTPPAVTGIVLVGDINSIGGATFSLDGVAVPYAPGAAQWLPTTPAYTKLVIPAPAGARVVRLIKGGQTLVANATVAVGQVTEIPVTGMMQELMEIQKADDQKDKVPAVVSIVPTMPTVVPVGPIEVFPDARFRQPTDEERRREAERRQPAPQPGMSMTSKLIIGGLVAAALGGGYYWYYKKSD